MRALLAEGADVDRRTSGGQTALMLAAIFGHVDIARLLLAAGADARLQDNLGLTAMEWAVRRGYSEVAQILSNASPAEVLSPKHVGAKDARFEIEGEREDRAEQEQVFAAETETASQDDALRWIKNQLRIIAEQERRKTEETSSASLSTPPIETTTASQQDALTETEEQLRAYTEPPSPQDRQEEKEIPQSAADEPSPPGTQYATMAARIEQRRILEESCQRVEAEVRAKSQRAFGTPVKSPEPERNETDIRQEAPSRKLSTQPATVEPKKSEAVSFSVDKRCPKCNTTFEDTILTFCAYDRTKLINADDPFFNPATANSWARPTIFALIAIMVAVGASIGFVLNNYFSSAKGPTAVAPAQVEQPKIPKKDLPTIGGALSGMEVSVPEAEYPENARSERVTGAIMVQVQVNKRGRVISARSSSGDWRLRAAAVEAAQKATFSAEKLAGRGATGTITYVFRPSP